MVTLQLLKLLEDNDLGELDVDLFWQKLGAGKNGVYIVDIGEPREIGKMQSVMFELYSRDNDDVKAYERLDKIVAFLNGLYGKCCELPEFDIYPHKFDKKTVLMHKVSTISNVGEDANGRVVYSATGRVSY